MSENMLKFIVALLILSLVASGFVGESETATLITAILAGLTLVAVISLGAERGTELLKMVLRFVFGNVSFLKAWQPSGAGSAFLAFLVSYAGVNQFNLNLFSDFKIFSTIDPQLISLLSIALTWIGSSLWHYVLPDAGKAQKTN